MDKGSALDRFLGGAPLGLPIGAPTAPVAAAAQAAPAAPVAAITPSPGVRLTGHGFALSPDAPLTNNPHPEKGLLPATPAPGHPDIILPFPGFVAGAEPPPDATGELLVDEPLEAPPGHATTLAAATLRMKALKTRKEAIGKELKTINKELEILRRETLPGMFSQVAMQNTRMHDRLFYRKRAYKVRVPNKAEMVGVVAWCRANEDWAHVVREEVHTTQFESLVKKAWGVVQGKKVVRLDAEAIPADLREHLTVTEEITIEMRR